MTDIAANPATASPKRPALWRVVSFAAVIAAIVVATMAVLQARDASDVALPDREPLKLEQVDVSVVNLPVPPGAQVSVLGLDQSLSRREFSVGDTRIDLPQDMAAVVALYNDQGDVIGLALAEDEVDRSQVAISARSTARALITLSPGILRPSLDDTIANVVVVEQEPVFERLVEAVLNDSNLSSSNPGLEAAYAEIADRLPVQRAPADQGCDSVVDVSAYASTGACVQPETTGIRIANEQDRWALLYSGAGWSTFCGAISPVLLEGSDAMLPSEQCVGETLLVAPGPISDQREDQDLVEQRVQAAAAVTALHGYVAPFADLAGSSAGYNNESVSHIRRNSRDIVGSIETLIENEEELVAALDVPLRSSAAIDRHLAAISAARILIEASDSTALIPQRVQGDVGHLPLLDFYQRSAEFMIASRTDWRWEADAVGTVDFGGGDS